jgi:hypothetical protein
MESRCVSYKAGAYLCLAALGGCAGPSADGLSAGLTERNRGNATVRATVYVEAALNVAAPTPVPNSHDRSTAKSVAARGKQDKRSVQPAPKDKRAASAAALAKQPEAPADGWGRSISQGVPVVASGYRYTYAVELDIGGTRTFGFATDQGLAVGDRVSVDDTGIKSLPK